MAKRIKKAEVTLSEPLIGIKDFNKKHIGWNMYESQRGPQPNMRGRVTYTYDAFWKAKVDDDSINMLLRLLDSHPHDFMVSHEEHDEEKKKYVFHYLLDPILSSKVLVLKIHRNQLSATATDQLDKLRDKKRNLERIALYKEADENLPEWIYGPQMKWVRGKKLTRTFHLPLGKTKTLPGREVKQVAPAHS